MPHKNIKNKYFSFLKANSYLPCRQAGKLKAEKGFTLMEIVVATTIFVVVVSAMMALFNYTLKINRRSEALRQATQGMRSFVEFLVKEVRNGQIDYYVDGGLNRAGVGSGVCNPPNNAVVGSPATGDKTYAFKDNKLGIITTDGLQECFYFGKDDNSYVDTPGGSPVTFITPANKNYNLIMEKTGISTKQILNPPNISIDFLQFLIRPVCDPFTVPPPSGPGCLDYGNNLPKIQPMVTILIRFVAKLPTGEQVSIPYQTTVSSNNYDIPNQ
jgi:prepilin-type N-terminal cleavage/methylation domain-containing protein